MSDTASRRLVLFQKSWYYITHWESWHWFAKYILIGPAWLWYSLKSGSLWFFTSSNPTITFGGYIGDTKKEVYDRLPQGTFPVSIFVSPGDSLTEIVRQMDDKALVFPVAVKPASGLMGFMFRKIETLEQLRQYHHYMPADYILQELVTYPLEVSVFYYRFPDKPTGTITGFIKKELLEVTGDGRSTLLQLILDYPRVQFRIEEMKSKHAARLDEVLPKGQHYCLSYALNLSRGGKLVSLAEQKDDRLLGVFDYLSHHAGGLYYGRYDIRCESIESLKAGKNFKILEFNGCGGEPHHVYGDGNTLLEACKILLHHWNILYRISTYNHTHGFPRWKHKEGYHFFKKALRHILRLKKLDKGFTFDAGAETNSFQNIPLPQAQSVS